MKLNKALLVLVPALLCLASCIKDEAPNAEADIEYVIIDDIGENFLVRKNDTIVEVSTDPAASNISVLVHPEADLASVTPRFKLTEGATIATAGGMRFDPSAGIPLDFSSPQTFVVTSEDGKWHKEYTLSFKPVAVFTRFSFEHAEKPGNAAYFHFFEVSGARRYDIWATGNPGYQFCGLNTFPTLSDDFGVEGKCVSMRTATTGGFGMELGMPIAAGNLFIGSFDVKNATTAPLQATRFGTPFNRVPEKLTGWYKYKPGDVMTDEKGDFVEGVDRPDIYMVMYRNSVTDGDMERSVTLDGSDVLSSEHIVGLARIRPEDIVTAGEDIRLAPWQRFELDFETVPGREIDRSVLENFGYSLAVVFSSSINGAYFLGAVGSTLCIDEVEIECE